MAEGPVMYLLEKFADYLERDFQPFSDVSAELISAKEQLEHVKAGLRDVDSSEDSNWKMKECIKHLRDAVYEFEDVLDEHKLLLLQDHGGRYFSCAHRIVNRIKARYRLIPHLKRICLKIRSSCEMHQMLSQTLYGTDHQLPAATGVESTWHNPRDDAFLLENTDLVGIEERKIHLIEWVLQKKPETQVAAIHGMGGSGKTTLAQQFFEDPVVKKHFALRVWITLSPAASTEELLKDMFQQVSSVGRTIALGNEGTVSIDFLKRSIKNLLLNGRYLIILDDVCHATRWEELKFIFPDNGLGSRIVLTTRHAEIAVTSCTDIAGNAYHLEHLSNRESWELFCRKTFQGNPCPTHLVHICKRILEKCEGLPLPIVTISHLLAQKDKGRIEEWNLVLRSLDSDMDGNSSLKKINKVLSLGFHDLPYYLKFCFQHLSLFPEGHAIEHKRILRLWVAEGFIRARVGLTPEEVAEECLTEILNRSLIQVVKTTTDGRAKMFRIHCFLRQMIIEKSKEQSFAANIEQDRAIWPSRLRRLSVYGVLKLQQDSKLPSQLRSLFMFGTNKESIKAALNCVKLLSVLDLQGAPLRKFPHQVIDMHFLKYLSLRYTKVKAIPSWIRKLQNLETLDLKHTNVRALPIETAELTRLCNLLVYRYETVSYGHTKYGFKPLPSIGSLHCLQKLCYIEADDTDETSSGVLVEELGKLTRLRRLCILKLKEEDGTALCSSIEKLTDLRSLSISALEDDEAINLEPLMLAPPLLQRIYLRGRLVRLPRWICSLETLVTLHLKCSNLVVDPLPSLQLLPNLVHLEMLQVYNWDMLHFQSGGFKVLRKLGLDNFDKLTHIVIEDGAMRCLETLIIQQCRLLQDVPSGIEHLRVLKVLEFYDVNDEIVAKLQPGEDYRKVAHIADIRYGFCRDGSWDVEKIRSPGEARPSSSQDSFTLGDLPRCWK